MSAAETAPRVGDFYRRMGDGRWIHKKVARVIPATTTVGSAGIVFKDEPDALHSAAHLESNGWELLRREDTVFGKGRI